MRDARVECVPASRNGRIPLVAAGQASQLCWPRFKLVRVDTARVSVPCWFAGVC